MTDWNHASVVAERALLRAVDADPRVLAALDAKNAFLDSDAAKHLDAALHDQEPWTLVDEDLRDVLEAHVLNYVATRLTVRNELREKLAEKVAEIGSLVHLVGDATRPVRHMAEKILVAHVVNDEGVWGRGFVMALSNRDRHPEMEYRTWHAKAAMDHRSILGHVQVVPFAPLGRRNTNFNIWVANMCAQRGWRRGDGDPQALNEEALVQCLRDVARWVTEGKYDRVVMPRIGAGLGGARWEDVERLIRAELCEKGVHVTVYSLPGERWENR